MQTNVWTFCHSKKQLHIDTGKFTKLYAEPTAGLQG